MDYELFQRDKTMLWLFFKLFFELAPDQDTYIAKFPQAGFSGPLVEEMINQFAAQAQVIH